jgi:hypothetical protein
MKFPTSQWSQGNSWYIAFLVLAILALIQVWSLMCHVRESVGSIQPITANQAMKARLELLMSEQRQSVGTTAWGEYGHRIDENLILLDAIRQDGE